MNQKVMLLLGLAVPLFAVACNSNPVVVPTQEDTPLLMQQDPTGQNKLVDLLWMIDDSGSMAQEQIGIIEGLQSVTTNLKSINFRLAVTSTDGAKGAAPMTNCAGGSCAPGQFRNKASVALNSGGIYTVDIVEKIFDSAFNNCLDPNLDATTRNQLETNFRSRVPKECSAGGDSTCDPVAVKAKRDKVTADMNQKDRGARNTYIEGLSKLMPQPDQLRTLNKSVLAFGDYDNSDGALTTQGLEAFRKDLTCLTLVGTTGSGIEEGLGAIVSAVDPKGPNKNNPLVLKERRDARFVTVIVSDENDCSHHGIDLDNKPGKKQDLNYSLCFAVACNVFNSVNVPDQYNPLRKPSELADTFGKYLRDAKGNPNYDWKNLASVITVTGTALPKPGSTLSGFSKAAADAVDSANGATTLSCTVDAGYSCTISNKTSPFDDPKLPKNIRNINKWDPLWKDASADAGVATDATYCMEIGDGSPLLAPTSKLKLEQVACKSVWGTSVSGDRYYAFAENFKKHFPERRGELGAMCETDFSNVFKALDYFVTGEAGDCIKDRLVPCESGAKAGDKCGPSEAQGVCVAYQQTSNQVNKGLFCSASLQPTFSCGTEAFFASVKKYCAPGTETGKGCILKGDTYNVDKACPGGVGVLFDLTKSVKDEILKQGCSIALNFTGFVGSSTDKKEESK